MQDSRTLLLGDGDKRGYVAHARFLPVHLISGFKEDWKIRDMATIANRLFRESAEKCKYATLTALAKHLSKVGRRKTEEILEDAKVPRHVIMCDGVPEPEYHLELAKNAIFEWRRTQMEAMKRTRKRRK